ncbi:hypothetical protein ARMGADRAFT_648908 [Armillaria gallica]|uniref:Uncharacterized protein n=1 Tax=Armillaria gallica TaxID=47427 RepID=A0A2H3EDX0_ARMGA|nr:hypothetical protein ARMGADRAFT_648908 [Armillaria gallica]
MRGRSLDFHVQVGIMGGFPVFFIGYELEDYALGIYQTSGDRRDTVKSLLRIVESETSRPASIVRYDDSKGQTHRFVCSITENQRNLGHGTAISVMVS